MNNNEIIGRIENKKISMREIGIKSNVRLGKLDSIAKTAILLVLAGYKKKDLIEINDEDLNDIIEMNNFSNLNLNFKKAAPRDFNIKINYLKKFSKNKKNYKPLINCQVILMLSGGIDSVAGLLYCLDNHLDVLPVWIDFGQKNIKAEEEKIDQITKILKIKPIKIRIKLKKYVDRGWNEWARGIVPGRNFMLLSLANLLVKKIKRKKIDIYLCGARGEITPGHNDKSPEFYKKISELFSKIDEKEIRVTTPFFQFNKAEILSFWNKKWVKKFHIAAKDTMTCYTGNNCGICSSCYYRRINSIVSNTEDTSLISNPLEDSGKLIREYYLKSFENWDNYRKVDFLIALSKNISILPREIKEFYERNINNFKKEIPKRIRQIEKVQISHSKNASYMDPFNWPE